MAITLLALAGPLASRGALAQDAPLDVAAPAPRAPDAPVPVPALQRARALLDAGDAVGAIALASEHAARAPEDADAWTVLGLAHFARGEHQAALAHFDRALSLMGAEAEDEAAIVHFNRAACVLELGRLAEAERAFAELAGRAPPPLSVLAALHAGFAALELDAPERARGHLATADRLDAGGELEVARQELRLELEAGEAPAPAPSGSSAATPAADPAREAYDAGVAAHERGERSVAREHFRAARAHGLDRVRDDNAEAYLDALAGGLRSIGRGWGASLSLGAGYDDNVAQSGIGDATAPLSFDHAEQGSLLLSASGEAGYGHALSSREFLLLEYSLEQLAYLDGDLDVFSSQDHALELGVEHSASEAMRLGLAGRVVYSIAGLRDFEPLSWTSGGEGWLTFAYGDHHETTLRGTLLSTRAIDDAFGFLEGTRVEAGVDQLYRRGRLRTGAGLRYRSEGLGAQTVVVINADEEGCPGCQRIYRIPLSYRGPGLYGWISLRLLEWLRASARAAAEWRLHSTASQLDVASPTGRSGILHERLQRDGRFGAGAGLTFDLGGPLELYLGYQLNVGTSNVDNTAGEDHELDYGNLNYTRNLVELELGAHF